MPSETADDAAKIKAHCIAQGEMCTALGSPFTGALCAVFAADIDAGGPCADLIGDWPTNPQKDALALRLCGALHHATLTGAAPDLAAAYPANNTSWDIGTIWPLARAYLIRELDTVRAFLTSPPQTNETRRAIALLPGFLKLAAEYDMPLHLLEIGASAGLNQNWDQFGYQTANWSRAGTSDVLVQTDWSAPPPAHLDAMPQIASRAACDLNPLNIHDPADALRLRCYIWPDQPDRLARFDAACALARKTGTHVEKADADAWLKAKLAARPQTGLTVVYHSVFLQYPPRPVIANIIRTIEQAGVGATPAAPLAWLCYEPEGLFGGPAKSPIMVARMQVWPSGREETFLCSDGHVTAVRAP